MPACTEFPIRERLDTSRGPHWLPCTELYQATSEQPCECTPQEDGCEPICIVPEAPTLPDACAGVTAPSEGPVICTAAEPPVTYVVSEIEVNTDPAVGFDLDGTEQASCVGGDLVGPDGPGGVDNSLSYVDLDELRPYLDLSVLSRRIFEQVCYGAATLAFEVYPNPEEGCATVSVLSSGEIVASAALHLDGDCLNGAIDRFMLPLPEEEVPLDNVRLTATLDPTGFSNMTLGATAGQYSGRRIFDVLGEQSSYEEYLDIRTDLDTTGMRCDAMSLTLDLGGATEVQ